MNPKPVRCASLMLALMLGATFSQAQTTPAKPPAQAARPAPAAAESKTLSGGANPGGKLLTRDELRACLKQRDALALRLSSTDAERGTLDAERSALREVQERLRAEREDLGGVKVSATELNLKVKTFQEQVDLFNKRVATFKEANSTGRDAERERENINRESEALQKRQAELQKEREELLARGDEAAKGFNAKSAAVDQKITDWNVRNAKLNDSGTALKEQRETWVKECGDRRYREDDEKAVLSGK